MTNLLGNFFRASKKVIFLSGQALTPFTLLVAGPLKKNNFFSASLSRVADQDINKVIFF